MSVSTTSANTSNPSGESHTTTYDPFFFLCECCRGHHLYLYNIGDYVKYFTITRLSSKNFTFPPFQWRHPANYYETTTTMMPKRSGLGRSYLNCVCVWVFFFLGRCCAFAWFVVVTTTSNNNLMWLGVQQQQQWKQWGWHACQEQVKG